ncbi:MAG: 8-amino-7-oxononanoate synthase [Marinilabiliales bacterium]|nr:MAG: 8-amino-7-oxononanoate synthase [Marinilabiliales bacterium]
MKTPEKIKHLMNQRRENMRVRTLLTPVSDLIDFWSNDYLGLAGNKELQHSFLKHLENRDDQFLFGSAGSRLVSGNHPVFDEAEADLALHFNAEAALLFPSGYMANLAFCSSVPQKNDLVLYDGEIHASIKASLRQSHADIRSFKHNDLNDLEKKLKGRQSEVYVMVESIYSISGDMAPLGELSDFCRSHSCRLIVDEAHSTGIYGPAGRGLCVECGIEDSVFARVYTFGKAVGTAGAILTCSNEIREYLINFAIPFVYSTAMPPVQVHSIMYNLNFIKKNEDLVESLKKNLAFFKQSAERNGCNELFSNFHHILNMQTGSDKQAVKLAKALRNHGFMVKAMLPPTVPETESSLRIILHSFNSMAEIENFFLHVKKLF